MSGYGGGGRGRAHWNDETQSWESEGTTPAGGTDGADSVAGGAGGVDSPAGGVRRRRRGRQGYERAGAESDGEQEGRGGGAQGGRTFHRSLLVGGAGTESALKQARRPP